MKNEVNILVLDDERTIRETLAAILEDEGYKVTTAGKGKEAIEEAKKATFNLAIVDFKLPDMDGLLVVNALKEINPELYVLMITAYATMETTIKALRGGAYDFILKPFEPDYIELVIKKALEKQRLTAERDELLKNLQIEKGKLEIILQIGQTMNAILNSDALTNFLVTKVSEVAGAEKVSLVLVDKSNGKLYIKSARGLRPEVIENTQIKIGEGIVGWVVAKETPLLVTDIEKDARTLQENRPGYKTKSFLSLPLKVKDRVIGVFNLADKVSGEVFTEDDLKFLSVIINQAAIQLEKVELYEEASHLAITDPVTGIFNHRYFQEHLTEEISRAERYLHPLSLLMVDIDSFKSYNDKYGHQTGDFILREIAQAMKINLRKVDVISRYGGEEFTIILPETKAEQAYIVAEKIRKKVETIGLTISIGVAEYQKTMDKDKLIKEADEALYQAKREGKNKSCTYTNV